MSFSVADGLKRLIDPLAQEVREFSVVLIETLDGITAEQRRTNDLLNELREKPTPVRKAAR